MIRQVEKESGNVRVVVGGLGTADHYCVSIHRQDAGGGRVDALAGPRVNECLAQRINDACNLTEPKNKSLSPREASSLQGVFYVTHVGIVLLVR